MVDKLGKELGIGQRVVYTRNPYADLHLGEVEKFTPKGIMIRYAKPTICQTGTIFKRNEDVIILGDSE